MSGGCPSCGVAVIPGYVKCPRCHAALPGGSRFRRSVLDPGGTSVEARAFPIIPVAVGAIAVAVLLLLVLGGGNDKPPPASAAGSAAAPAGEAVEPAPAGAAPDPAAPAVPAAAGEPAVPAAASAPVARPLDIPSAAGPSPGAVTAELERALARRRLWSSVQASGERVDVRSGSCAEPEMGPLIDAARPALRGAGLTRLRCLAQSGAVVFERDL
jgi:hypothetical protein